MCTLETLLTIPTDTITECPAVAGSSDVRWVAEHLEALLNKCLYCIRLRLPLPLEILLTVIGEAGDQQSERVSSALLQPADEGIVADVFTELSEQLLSRRAAAIRLQIDVEVFFKVMQIFCCTPLLKDCLGERLGGILLGFMLDFDRHIDDYRVHRHCCSAFISLLRGSPDNKNRFGPECSTVAACLEGSSDFFFQMQCIEVLYRLYKHQNAFLASIGTTASSSLIGKPTIPIDPYLLRGIEELPNDSTLLISIHQLLDNYNRDIRPGKIVAFAALRIEVSGVEVTRATTLYFSRLLLVMLLPGTDNQSGSGYLTIPYEHVRSVKLTKDHKLELRLYAIPAKLAQWMSTTRDGFDKMHIFLTRTTMRDLRSSCVHEWVAERKRLAPRRTIEPRIQLPRCGEGPAAPHAGAALSLLTSHVGSRKNSASQPSLTTADTTMAERHVNIHDQSRSSSAGGNQLASAMLLHEQQRQRLRSAADYGQHRGLNSNDEDKRENGGDHQDETCVGLTEIHRAASVRAARYRGEQHETLQRAVDSVNDELEALHRFGARERDLYETHFREDMGVIRRSEAVLKESATDCVRALNTELEDVQALGALLKDEVDKLRERLAKSLGKSEGTEEACLMHLKQLVDAHMRNMEATLLSLGSSYSTASSASVLPDDLLADVWRYISQKMHSISNGSLIVSGAAASTDSTGVRGGIARSAPPLSTQPMKERRLDYS